MTPISIAENRDCMEAMKEFPDGFFELAICDPPYGIGIVAPGKRSFGHRKGMKKLTTYKSATWDNEIPDEEYFVELFRVSQNQIIWGGNYFTQYLPGSPSWIVWDKNQPIDVSFAQAELAYSSFERSTKVFYYTRGQEKKQHPTQKPIALYQWLLKNYGKPGNKILDTHLGSGSSRIAAYKMGFDFWGYEIDKDYFEAQEKRFKEAIAEPLFESVKLEQGKLI
jgi:site-specific DNA-methyltransferase (adenine-specific)